MLVAHQSDHITHAVIGGKKSINFGISDDPAFFQILSSALYKDPMLAMVRETICNAWDAHIDSGNINKPIEISLDDDYLIIKDFGKGIPDALIGPIYGVYGASTKKNDGRQTGGFGLGCKSPFAYTDHFEVTSCHDGAKTIYNMSKSSAQMQGKPSIVPIASFSTTESGITVKIPLDPNKNNSRLHDLVQQVVFNGDIKAKWKHSDNDELMPILGLDNSECGMVLINDSANCEVDINFFQRHRIFVRYCNVIYPIESAPEFQTLFSKVNSLLNNYYNCKLVLLAPPDSISITPSRESLTLSDITIGTVTMLLTKFLAVFFKNQELMHRHQNLVNEFVDKASKQDVPLQNKLPLDSWVVPGIPTHSASKILTNTDDFAMLEVLLRYSGRRGTIKRKQWFGFISRYMFNMEGDGLFDRGMLQSWHRTAGKYLKKLSNPDAHHHYRQNEEVGIATKWWQRQVLYPLIVKMKEALPDFSKEMLSYTGSNVIIDRYNKQDSSLHVGQVKIESHTHNILHLLKPTIVVSHNTALIGGRVRYAMQQQLIEGVAGTLTKGTYFSYQVPRRKGEAERVVEALRKMDGVEVIDLTGRLPHEQDAYEERQAAILKARTDAAAGKKPNMILKKAKPGLVRYDFILDSTGKQIDTKILANSADPERITDPEFVVLVSTGRDARHETRDIPAPVAFAAAKLYGSKGAVTNKENAHSRYISEKKAVDISDYLLDRILVDVQTLPTLLEYHACNRQKMEDYISEKVDWRVRRDISGLARMLMDTPALNHLIPTLVPLSPEDQYRMVIWNNIGCIPQSSRRQEVQLVREKIERIALKPEITKFLDGVIGNKFLGLIDVDATTELLKKPRDDPAMTAKIVSFITTILS